eukprot:787514-Prymnesium_polylepis.1
MPRCAECRYSRPVPPASPRPTRFAPSHPYRRSNAGTPQVGNNSGGNRLLPVGIDVDCPEGFAALPGWDPTTGLGAPNFEQLRVHALTPCALLPHARRAACRARLAAADA